MSEAEARPDPDALLRRIQSEEERARRGRLKIWLGFAPGVGKTFAMLENARELQSAGGGDVVVGWVDTHGRYDTAALLLGLEILPRRAVPYRGRTLEEFDLDAALARKPAVLLLDELAHTNAPGGRHPKRWQDVEELLDAGIEVHTTLNVQHVESLNDVVAQITGVVVRETVPDAIVDRANEIVLVDLAPEELLERLREGKVYLGEQRERAAQGFFRRGNLLALRELALRRAAERVDVDVVAWRREHRIQTPWPAGERILVCVGPAPASLRLVRAGRRMAAGLRAPWFAAWVERPGTTPLSQADRERLESHLRLAESLGASVVRLEGMRPAEAILAWAREHNATRIVIGKPTHARWRDRLRGSLLDAIVRGSGEIDVHVISGDEPAEALPRAARPRAAGAGFGEYLGAAALVAVATALGSAAWRFVERPDVAMLYLLGIMLTAVRASRGPAIFAAALSTAAYDFFFVPPYFTFAVSDLRHLLTFAMMFAVGIVISALAQRIRGQEQAARGREERTATLYALARDLGAALDEGEAARAVARHAAEVFGGGAAVLLPGAGGALAPAAVVGDVPFDASQLGVARWAFEHARPAGAGTDTLPGARVRCMPLASGARVLGVLALAAGPETGWRADDRHFLDAFVRQGVLAIERARLGDEAKLAALRARAEELRSSLLSAVSHDLRTPLAAITGAASALRDDAPGLDASQRTELLDTIAEEAERLERLLANLLDMTRLESGGVELRREWVPVEEIVGAVLGRLEPRLAGRPVRTELPSELPLLAADPLLLEQLLLNLIENAVKYTPPASPIEITATVRDGELELTVADRGPGLPRGEESRVFEKFFRGAHPGVPGAGLGLAICRAIAEAHGGKLMAESRPGGGALFRLLLPLEDPGAGASAAAGAEEGP
jgi:two-component system sensor histidine kinase KdpD